MRQVSFLILDTWNRYLSRAFEGRGKPMRLTFSFQPIEISIHHYHHYEDDRFSEILGTLESIMADQAKLADVPAILDDISNEVTKIGTETDGLLAKIAELLANPPTDPQQAALVQAIFDKANAIKTSLQAVDDKVPDTVVG
jgi:hypothetical protein